MMYQFQVLFLDGVRVLVHVSVDNGYDFYTGFFRVVAELSQVNA